MVFNLASHHDLGYGLLAREEVRPTDANLFIKLGFVQPLGGRLLDSLVSKERK
jgi:hypothetical protein